MSDKSKNQLPDNVNWEYLKRFKICAESKNFKEAAHKISTSANALSAQIDALEESLGTPLFERVNQNRTSTLTHHGERIVQLVSMASLYLSGSRPVKNVPILQEEEKQKIRIVTTPGLADTFLPKLIDPFLSNYSHYQIEVIGVGPAVKIQGDEIVIRADIKDQKDIVKETLFDTSLNLYAHSEYLKKMGTPTTLEDLQHHHILAFNAFNYGSSNWVWGFLRTKGLSVTAPLLSDSIDFLHEMCCKGHGILELPDIYPRSPDLIRVLKNIESPKYSIMMAFHKSCLSKSNMTDFLNFTLNLTQSSLDGV